MRHQSARKASPKRKMKTTIAKFAHRSATKAPLKKTTPFAQFMTTAADSQPCGEDATIINEPEVKNEANLQELEEVRLLLKDSQSKESRLKQKLAKKV